MAGMQFTAEQIKVIETHDKNILVSAAAGSGKTAVLVERIIQMLVRAESPVNVDQLLVVTFTNAAASEMRERIGDAIEAQLEVESENVHLQRQLALLSSASIMTIHAFCLKIIKNHFDRLELDPGFRIADENELLLIKQEVLKEVLETFYQEEDEAFIDFVEGYASGKTDEGIEALIFDCHRFAMSNPWPKEWLDSCCTKLDIDGSEGFEGSIYGEITMKNAKELLIFASNLFENAYKICQKPDGPIHYLDSVNSYLEAIDLLSASIPDGFTAFQEKIVLFEPFKLSAKRSGFDKSLKEAAKSLIDRGKEAILNLKKDLFSISLDSALEDIRGTYRAVAMLSKLTMAFDEGFAEIKQDKGLIDFNDIEHFALNILVQEDEAGNRMPSPIAKIYQEQYKELLLDEYQDTNLVQETILQSVSKESRGKPNTFMVGDVKQSIYKFRLAKPELFMEKYDKYMEDEGDYIKLHLGKNFRSRDQVLDTVNFLFEQLMTTRLGDVIYDDHAALNLGAAFEPVDEELYISEMILIHDERGEQAEADDEISEDNPEEENEETVEEDLSQRELEAQAIGRRIKALVDEQSVMRIWDKSLKAYRKPSYKDIVILLRTNAGWSEPFEEMLGRMEIPTYSDTKTGYLDTVEIRTILNLLQLIDNPRQDIPLVAVLRSPIIGLKGEDFVKIRTSMETGEMYEALLQYIAGAILMEDELAPRLNDFLNMLDNWRKMSRYLPMDDLLRDIYEKTRYLNYMMLMPSGRQRQANLEMLIDRAVAFETSSYRGVFHFIRYVEQIKKYDMDLGEASVLSENDDLVRIMSIHKSKGLEFPIVIVAGLGKRFNKQDLHRGVLFHQDLGIGADFVDSRLRFKVVTIPKHIIKNQIETEMLSEELRILYVALTRAKEKLIMTGFVKGIEKKVEKWGQSLSYAGMSLPYNYLKNGQCYMDWVLPALIRHRASGQLRDYMQTDGLEDAHLFESRYPVFFDFVGASQSQVVVKEGYQESKSHLLEMVDSWKVEGIGNEQSSSILNWQYPYEKRVGSPVQMSVSELKRIHYEEVWQPETAVNIKPEFITREEGLSSAQKGTAFHKVMCGLDFKTPATSDAITLYLNALEASHRLTELERKSIPVKLLINFLQHPICKRMTAAESGVKRETPFVLGIAADELEGNSLSADDIFMVQGVIDAYFEEDNELILVDYKTDYFEIGEEDIVKARYRIQMDYYKRALEQISDKKVKESWIYAVRQNIIIAMA